MKHEFVKTIEFPIDLIEDEWVSVQIYNGPLGHYSVLTWPPKKRLDSDVLKRLEDIGLSLFFEQEQKRLTT